jgi:hypothetical protein
MFGGSHSGYILAYVFKLYDERARGFTRWFAFIVLDADALLIMHRWSWIVEQFSRIVHAEWKVRCDPSLKSSNSSASSSMSDQAMLQEKQSDNPTPVTSPSKASGSRGYHGPSKGPLRPLDQLLENPILWKDLHNTFTSMCRRLRSAFTLRSLVYVPLAAAAKPTVARLTAASSTSSFSRPASSHSLPSSDTSSPTVHREETDTSVWASLPDTSRTIGALFRELCSVMGEGHVRKMLWWIILGNQVVVVGKSSSSVSQIVLALSQLVPVPCRTVEPYSDKYVPSYEVAFLGLTDLAELQLPFDPSVGLVLDWNNKTVVCGGADAPSRHLLLDEMWSVLMCEQLSVAAEKHLLDSIVLRWVTRAAIVLKVAPNAKKIQAVLATFQCMPDLLYIPVLKYWATGLVRSRTIQQGLQRKQILKV